MRLGRAFRKTGKAVLKAQRQASRLNEGLDEILGANRTKPSDGVSSDRTRQRASLGINKKSRMKSKLSTSKEGKQFDLSFGKNQGNSEDDEERRFF